MPNNRKPATGSDARAKKRTRPNAAGIAAAMRYWQQSFAGSQTPPDPEKTKAAGRAPEAALKDSNEHPQDSTTTLLLARLMPRAAASLLANGAAVAGLGQLLPVAVAAVSGVLR